MTECENCLAKKDKLAALHPNAVALAMGMAIAKANRTLKKNRKLLHILYFMLEIFMISCNLWLTAWSWPSSGCFWTIPDCSGLVWSGLVWSGVLGWVLDS